MREPRPVVCTLTAAELSDRGAAWQRLFASGLLHRESTVGEIVLRAEPGAWDALSRLIALERECCAWIDYEIDGLTVRMSAAGAGAEVLAEMFQPASG